MRAVIKAKTLVVNLQHCDTLDLYLLNETNQPHPREFSLTMTDPTGESIKLGILHSEEWERDKFVYPLKQKFATPLFTQEGVYTFTLRANKRPEIHTEEKILVIQQFPEPHYSARVGVLTHERNSLII